MFRHAGKVQDCPYCEQAHIRLVSRDEMEQFRKLVEKMIRKRVIVYEAKTESNKPAAFRCADHFYCSADGNLLLRSISKIKRQIDPRLKIDGILLAMVDPNLFRSVFEYS